LNPIIGLGGFIGFDLHGNGTDHRLHGNGNENRQNQNAYKHFG
jgi:hypothetical protein